MAQSEISRWAGRADLKQNCVINQISEFEMVATAEAMDTSLTLSSPKCAVSPNDPITAQELDLMEHGPQHVTEFGVCVHDWVMSPCEKFRDCLNCSEQVCIKGNVERLNRIKAQLVEVEKNYAQAKDALAKGYAGADRWFEHHKRMVAHLRKMVKILEDTDLPDGTQIKLRDGKEYSHLRRAIQARTADAQLHNSTEASLLLEMSKMLGGGLG
jgi:hypothetical protein